MNTGLQVGLVITALGLGFRHGIDWDHIAALTDITGSQVTGRRSMFLATMYALGHALVVFALGVVAIVASAEVPDWLDDVMSRVVGVTLLTLGVYVFVSLVRHGRDFRMRSRWMLMFAAVRRSIRWLEGRRTRTPVVQVISHDHDHSHDELHRHDHTGTVIASAGSEPEPSSGTVTTTHHRHLHHHVGTVPDDPFPTYGSSTAFAVGTLHGIGAETPTQILVFLAAARAGGAAIGIALLVCFVAGLLVSNTVVALTAAFGFLGASRHFATYATVSIVAASFSLVVGTLFVLGQAPLLPALAGG